MASDPTDLIREASAALDGITPGKWWVEVGSFDQAMTVHIPVEGNGTNLFTCVDCGTAAETERDHAFFVADAPDLVRRLRDALEGSADLRMAREANAAAVEAMNERDAANSMLAEVLTAITGETEQALSVRNSWIVAEAGGCTCYGGGPYGHEPGCGYEPIVKLADVGRAEAALADANATISRVKALANVPKEERYVYLFHAEDIRRVIEGPARGEN